MKHHGGLADMEADRLSTQLKTRASAIFFDSSKALDFVKLQFGRKNAKDLQSSFSANLKGTSTSINPYGETPPATPSPSEQSIVLRRCRRISKERMIETMRANGHTVPAVESPRKMWKKGNKRELAKIPDGLPSIPDSSEREDEESATAPSITLERSSSMQRKAAKAAQAAQVAAAAQAATVAAVRRAAAAVAALPGAAAGAIPSDSAPSTANTTAAEISLEALQEGDEPVEESLAERVKRVTLESLAKRNIPIDPPADDLPADRVQHVL